MIEIDPPLHQSFVVMNNYLYYAICVQVTCLGSVSGLDPDWNTHHPVPSAFFLFHALQVGSCLKIFFSFSRMSWNATKPSHGWFLWVTFQTLQPAVFQPRPYKPQSPSSTWACFTFFTALTTAWIILFFLPPPSLIKCKFCDSKDCACIVYY